MFFPIGDDQIRGGHYPIFSYTFLVMNVLIFLYQMFLAPAELEQFVYRYSAIPTDILDGKNWHTLLTSIFLHGGWMHLIGNMLFLWVFADNIEASVGNLGFLLFYILGGVLASLAHVYFNPISEIPSLGASGAISAVLGAYLVMFPGSKVKVFVFLVVILRRVTMSALIFLGLWIGLQLFSGFQNMGIGANEGGTAWWAHIGGFAVGILFGFLMKNRAAQFELG